MAIVTLGGLVTSVFVTLFVTPVVFLRYGAQAAAADAPVPIAQVPEAHGLGAS